MFNIDFLKLIKSLLPGFLKGSKLLAWLQSLIKPVVDLYSSFLAYRDQILKEARITGQVNCIEYLLNSIFYANGALRRIFIADNESLTDPVYVYNSSESGPETYLYNTSEVSADDVIVFQSSEGIGGVDFNVMVPSTLIYDLYYMTSLINQYKLAGTTYQILSYDE